MSHALPFATALAFASALPSPSSPTPTPLASAQDSCQSSFSKHPWTMEVVVGWATPYGELGAAGEYAMAEFLVLSAGVGLGVSGPQLGLMPRLRLPLSHAIALGVEGGLSVGPYNRWPPPCFMNAGCGKPGFEWNFAQWANLGTSLDTRIPLSRSGGDLQVRLFFGRAHMLNPHGYTCSADEPGASCASAATPEPDLLNLYYGGIAVGGSFSISGPARR